MENGGLMCLASGCGNKAKNRGFCEKHYKAHLLSGGRIRKIDRTGERHGRLVILSKGTSGPGGVRWVCKCDCGTVKEIYYKSLKKGLTKSCGCKSASRGGLGQARVTKIWREMHSRCSNEKNTAYKSYGGRGIRVCERWDDLLNFIADMGHPQDRMEIDRIDVNGNYEPQNCRWATHKEQCRNKRNTIFVEFNGKRLPLADAAEQCGIRYETVRYRIKYYGWPVERALSEPSKGRFGRG